MPGDTSQDRDDDGLTEECDDLVGEAVAKNRTGPSAVERPRVLSEQCGLLYWLELADIHAVSQTHRQRGRAPGPMSTPCPSASSTPWSSTPEASCRSGRRTPS